MRIERALAVVVSLLALGAGCTSGKRSLLIVKLASMGPLDARANQVRLKADAVEQIYDARIPEQGTGELGLGLYLPGGGDAMVIATALGADCVFGTGSGRAQVPSGGTATMSITIAPQGCGSNEIPPEVVPDGGDGVGGGAGTDGGDGTGGMGGGDDGDGTDGPLDLPPDGPPPPGAPALVRPWNGENTGSVWLAGNLRPTFRWNAVAGAASYEIEIGSACPGFPAKCDVTPSASMVGLSTTSFKPTADLPAGRVAPVGQRTFWRVRACGDGGCGDWSAVRYLNVGRLGDDFDGDGYSDTIVGSEDAASYKGRAYLFGGGPMGWSTAPTVTFTGVGSTSFAAWVAAVGDVNADGFGDFAVGEDGGGAAGRAHVYYGAAKLGPSLAKTTILGGLDNGYFGGSIAGAGDVNADGFSDVIVGDFAAFGAYRGGASVFLGGASVATTPAVTYKGENDGDRLGIAVAGAGDVDGDGFADLIVGAHSFSSATKPNLGRAYLYRGGSGTLASMPALTLDGNGAGAFFGIAVSGAGDMNGDGYADFVVGEYGFDAAHVFFGGKPLDGAPDLDLAGASGSDFGWEVAGGFDADRDGFADLMVGAWSSDGKGDGTQDGIGEAFVFRGGAKPSLMPGVKIIGEKPYDNLGDALGAVEDFNGDGFADFIVGSSEADLPMMKDSAGRAAVYIGGATMDGTKDVTYEGEEAGDNFGISVD